MRVKPEQCWAARHIFSKLSASLVNGQNDSSRHIIFLDDFLHSNYSRNRFSPTLNLFGTSRVLFIKSCSTFCIKVWHIAKHAFLPPSIWHWYGSLQCMHFYPKRLTNEEHHKQFIIKVINIHNEWNLFNIFFPLKVFFSKYLNVLVAVMPQICHSKDACIICTTVMVLYYVFNPYWSLTDVITNCCCVGKSCVAWERFLKMSTIAAYGRHEDE